MKERPILFSAPMVRAILEGRKTQTRRVVNPQPENGTALGFLIKMPNASGSCAHFHRVDEQGIHGQELTVHCPFGQPGDRLWVREAWRIGAWDCDIGGIAVDYCDAQRREWLIPFATKTEEPHEVFERLWIDCCDELAAKGIQHDSDGRYNWKAGESPLRWRPSIHMPRWASRINLEITGVRVERLNDISEADALAEGIESLTGDKTIYHWDFPNPRPNHAVSGYKSATAAYKELWSDIYGRESLDGNPWVWVVEFRRV